MWVGSYVELPPSSSFRHIPDFPLLDRGGVVLPNVGCREIVVVFGVQLFSFRIECIMTMRVYTRVLSHSDFTREVSPLYIPGPPPSTDRQLP